MEDNRNDFAKKYDHTWFKHGDSVYYGQGFVSDTAYLVTEALSKKKADLVFPMNARPWFPRTGFYNGINNYVPIFICRTGYRQWRRSYCDGAADAISVFYHIMEPLLSGINKTHHVGGGTANKQFHNFFLQNNVRAYAFNADAVYTILKHVYPDYKQAFRLLESKLAVAIDPDLILMHSLEGPGVDLWYHDHRIGRASLSGIECLDTAFSQEINDYIRRNNVFKGAA